MSVLARLRESLGFTLEEVAAAAGWSRERQRTLEHQPPAEVDEADALVLSDLFGVDVVEVLEQGSLVGLRTPVAGLLKARADVLDAESRFALAEAASVAREAREIQRSLGRDTGWKALTRFKDNPDYSHPSHGTPARLAQEVRAAIGLSPGPIDSIRTRILDPLGVLVIGVRIDPEIDAFSFATARTGGVIVLNEAAPTCANAFFRRVALAHELCHLLFDRKRMRAVADFGAHRVPTKAIGDFEELERRARAFAVALLAPEDYLRVAWTDLTCRARERRVRVLMEIFGLGYEATRGQLANAGILGKDEAIPNVPTQVPAAWEERDPAPTSRDDALGGVRPQRRGVLLDLLCEAWSAGLLSEPAVREGLRLGPAAGEAIRPALLARLGRRPALCWSTSSAVHG